MFAELVNVSSCLPSLGRYDEMDGPRRFSYQTFSLKGEGFHWWLGTWKFAIHYCGYTYYVGGKGGKGDNRPCRCRGL